MLPHNAITNVPLPVGIVRQVLLPKAMMVRQKTSPKMLIPLKTRGVWIQRSTKKYIKVYHKSPCLPSRSAVTRAATPTILATNFCFCRKSTGHTAWPALATRRRCGVDNQLRTPHTCCAQNLQRPLAPPRRLHRSLFVPIVCLLSRSGSLHRHCFRHHNRNNTT